MKQRPLVTKISLKVSDTQIIFYIIFKFSILFIQFILQKSSSGGKHGKVSVKAGGHNVHDNSGHKGSAQTGSHYQHAKKWGKKGGSKGGKQYHTSSGR